MQKTKPNYLHLFVFLVLSMAVYGYIYGSINRVTHKFFQDFGFQKLIVSVLMLLGLQLFFYLKRSNFGFKHLVVAYCFLQIPAFFALPNLSDDFYRFFLDGQISSHGVSPYTYKPSELSPDFLQTVGVSHANFKALNSPNYYSIYPPLNQVFFVLAAFFSKGSLLIFVNLTRILLVLFNVLAAYFMYKLKNNTAVFCYLFNPLLNIETTGNLHFEGVYLAFLLGSIYFFLGNKTIVSAGFLAASIATKLIPLLFVPLFLGWRNDTKNDASTLKKRVVFCTTTLGWLAIGFCFLGADSLAHILQSTKLYYSGFEFNASVFYVLRWFGFRLYGYDLVHIIAPFLGFVTVLFIAKTAILGHKKHFLLHFWHCMLVYLLLAAVVHPWYAIPLLALGLLCDRALPSIVFSFVVLLSYSAYCSAAYLENPWFIATEYGLFALSFYPFLRQKAAQADPKN